MKPIVPLFLSIGFLLGCEEEKSVSEPKSDNQKTARELMVRSQIESRGVKDKRVLQAMRDVPRHEFVLPAWQRSAYEDNPLPIGFDQTISQPYIVALMTEKLEPSEKEKVLEIGTGSGYQAAILAKLVKHVYTIEIVEELAKRAKEALKPYPNVTVKAGDGYKGWSDYAPFDAIIVTCAPDHIPKPLVDQLREGGRMMIPVGKEGAVQELILLEKRDGTVQKKTVLQVRFVPMTGALGK